MGEEKTPALPGKDWDLLSVPLQGETLRAIESDVYALLRYGTENEGKAITNSWLFRPGCTLLEDQDQELAKKIQSKMKESGSWVLQVAAGFVTVYRSYLLHVMLETIDEMGNSPKARPFPTLEYNMRKVGLRRAADAKEEELLCMVESFLNPCGAGLTGNMTDFHILSPEKEAAEAQHMTELGALQERSAQLQGFIASATRTDWDFEISSDKDDGQIVALQPDGSVVAKGNNGAGQCAVERWRNVVAVVVGRNYTAGLTADGSVLAAGDNADGACNVRNWHQIRALTSGWVYTVGLTADGRVLYTDDGKNKYKNKLALSAKWRDITAISASWFLLAGVRTDGTVAITPASDTAFNSSTEEIFQNAADFWNCMASVSCGQMHLAGLRTDGTVVAAGDNQKGQCNVSDWSNIVSVCCGNDYTVGLRADGTVVYTGGEGNRSLQEVSGWHDIVGISICPWSGGGVFGIRRDGRVVAATTRTEVRSWVADWKLFSDLEHLDEERSRARKLLQERDEAERKRQEAERKRKEAKRKRQEEERKRQEEEERKRKEAEEKKKQEYRTAKLCQHCGGSFAGFFIKKCSVCGRRKDY